MPRWKKDGITSILPTARPTGNNMDFAGLVAAIRGVHESCSARAVRAVNASLTLRNWIIGAYIDHYELH